MATKERLSRATVAGRALELADAEGIDALTIRRLATDLGVTPMALYWHFADKERLLDGVAERVLDEVSLPADDGSAAWDVRLRAVLDELVRVLAAHPATTDVVKGRILASEPGVELTERVLGLFAAAGFSAERAAQLAVYCLVYIVGLVAGQPGTAIGREDEASRDDRVRAKWAALQALSPARYPHVVAAAGPLTDCHDDTYFPLAMDLLVNGLRELPRG